MFQHITELLTDDYFVKGQLEFMTKHNAVFEDSDENKLEYTPLYEQYIMLTELSIESSIKSKLDLSTEDVEAFYTSLKDENKIKALEAINKETVDHLYTLIDFNRFKQQMLECKKVAQAAPKNEDESSLAVQIKD